MDVSNVWWSIGVCGLGRVELGERKSNLICILLVDASFFMTYVLFFTVRS